MKRKVYINNVANYPSVLPAKTPTKPWTVKKQNQTRKPHCLTTLDCPPGAMHRQWNHRGPGPPECYTHMLLVIEEKGKDIRPPCADSKGAREPLKGGIITTQTLVGVESAWQTRCRRPPHPCNRMHLGPSHCRALASPGLYPKLHFPSWASWPVSLQEPGGDSHSSLQY